MAAYIAEREATGKPGSLKEQNASSTLGKRNLDQNKAEAKADTEFIQDSDDKNCLDLDYGDLYHEAAEDADDEIDMDDFYEEIRPLNIRKVKTSKVSNSVPLSTNHPEQSTQTTAHTHCHVEWADNLAQAPKDSAEANHTAPIASEFNLPRAPTPYPEPLAIHKYPDLLHPSPPLRRRKGSMALRKKASESATAHSMMPKTGENQDALFGHDQDNVAENSYTSNTYTTPTHRGKMTKAHGNQTAFSGEDQSNTYTTPTHRGKMAEAHGNQKAFSGEDQSNTYTTPSHRGKMVETHGNQNAFSGEDQGNTAENDESSKASLNLDWDFPEDETSGLSKTNAEEGHKEEDTTTAAKSMTNTVTSPKASSNKKRSLRNFFRRKGSKESTSSPSSSSAKTAGRRIISAPTLVNASPDAKAILNSATPLTNTPSHAKKVVNYSRPTAPQSSNNESSGSPVGRGRSGSGMRGPNPSYTSPEDDGESLNRSGYSGGEDSVQRAVAVPVVASGRAKQVQVRPPRTINTAPSDIDLGMGIAVTSGTSRMTDEEAMALGVQDAERYMANAMTLQIRPAATSMDDPFVGPAPTQRTALGGSTSTNGERAYAAALSDRHKKGNNTTVRGQLEGYSRR